MGLRGDGWNKKLGAMSGDADLEPSPSVGNKQQGKLDHAVGITPPFGQNRYYSLPLSRAICGVITLNVSFCLIMHL